MSSKCLSELDSEDLNPNLRGDNAFKETIALIFNNGTAVICYSMIAILEYNFYKISYLQHFIIGVLQNLISVQCID